MSETVIRTHADMIWRVADKLRAVYRQSEYGRVILPFNLTPAKLRARCAEILSLEAPCGRGASCLSDTIG